NVVLDPDTAHPRLVLLEDRKSIRAAVEDQCLPKNHERFENWLYVLGCQGFSTGRHFWEVTVGKEEEWSVNRKDYIEVCPEEGIWEVGKWEGKYQANLPQESPEMPLSKEPKRIRVSLNCEGICTFLEAGETLLPSLLCINACLTLSP
ncbi:thaicobrin-like, partial [Python bivittatus]|uniref:Thaicobrin-like n=1 Tax=Python bivittatus TaxID=176946 RepID=A0A9F5IX87_PYTBI